MCLILLTFYTADPATICREMQGCALAMPTFCPHKFYWIRFCSFFLVAAYIYVFKLLFIFEKGQWLTGQREPADAGGVDVHYPRTVVDMHVVVLLHGLMDMQSYPC